MAQWIEVKARYVRATEDGKVKKVTEPYLVDALSCTEAEARVVMELGGMDGLEVKATKKTNIAEVWHGDGGNWYLARTAYITVDEKTAVVKKSVSSTLVGGHSFDDAYRHLNEKMRGTITDWELVSLAETKIMDVYEA